MARYGDDGADLTELTLGPPGISARKARRARKNGHPASSSATYVTQVDPVNLLLQSQ
jgi:auxin-responsive protein IAA